MTQDSQHETYPEIREAVQKLCARFPGEYWRALDREMAYPTAFVDALTEAGYLSVLIPEEYGGSGLPLSAAAAVLEEVQRAGCNGGACHAQMYTMGTVLRHGSEAQKRRYLPGIAEGSLRLQAFGVTEPTSGTDTAALKTTARRDGDTLRLTVADDGVGWQGAGTPRGTGLGSRIVRAMASNLRAQIDYAQAEKGTAASIDIAL